MMENREVIGVLNDFHYFSLRDEIRPVMLFMNKEWNLDDLLIRVSPEHAPETMQYIRSVWKEIAPGLPFNATFLDEDFRKEYEEEMRWARIVNYSSLFAISLACLGLFGLATLAVASRTKEIGIRKILGASVPGLLQLISRDFLKLVIFANIFAWPAAYYLGLQYLEDYAYRIEIGWWIFAVAGGSALLIALLTVCFHAVKAAFVNPVDSLRYE
jgi:putative ABC transport system permease protein